MRSGEGHEETTARAPKRPWRTVRRVVSTVAIALVLLVVAAAVISRTAGFRRFATSLIADAVTNATGRQLSVGNAPALWIGLAPAVVAEDIVLSNATWGSRREMVRARKVELQTRLLPLLRGQVVVERLMFVGLDVLLETDTHGTGNWEFGATVPAAQPSPRAGPPSLLSRLDVGEVLINDSCLVLHDHASGKQTRIVVDRLRLARNRLAPENLNVDLALTFDGVPISLSGTLGGPAALVSATEPFPVDVVVKTDGAAVGVEGRIGRVWAFQGVDLGVRAEVTDPAALGRALGARLPGGGPWRVEGRLHDEGSGYSAEPLQVALGGNTLTGSMQASGAGTSLKLSGSGIELASLLAALGVKAEVSGGVGEFAADVRTSGGTPRDWVANLTGQVRVARGSVVVGGGTPIEVERADVMSEAGGLGVEAVGSVGGVPLTVSGTVGGAEALAFGGKPFPVDVVVGTDGATVGVEGQVGGAGTSLKLSGSGIELAPLLAALGVKTDLKGSVGGLVADLQTRGATPRVWLTNLTGQVRVTQGSVVVGGGTRIEVERADVVSEVGGLGVEVVGLVAGVPLTVSGTVGGVEELAFGGKPLPVKVVVGTDGGTAAIDGVIGRVWAFEDVDLGVRAEVTDPAALGRVLGARLPGGGPWRVEGRIHDEGPGYSVEPLQVALGGTALDGAMRLGEAGTSLKLSGSGIELAPLLAAFGVKDGPNGSVAEFGAEVRTRGTTPRDWVVNLEGQVHLKQGNVVAGGGTRVEVERADVVSEVGGLGVQAVGSVGGVPLTVSGMVGGMEELAFGGKPLPVRVVVGADSGTAAIDGVIERVWAFEGVDLGVRVEVTDPAALGCALGVGLTGGGPWQIEGRVRDTGAGYAIDPTAAAFAGNTVTGRVGIDWSGARPTLTADLSAVALNLSALGGTTGSAEVAEHEARSPVKEGPVFSSAPLPLRALTAADGRASLSFDNVALRQHAVAGAISVHALLSDGSLVVEPIVLRTAGGTITGSVRIDSAGTVSAKLAGEAIELGALVAALGGTAKATGGTTSLRLDLHSSGRSLHEWMANLGGEIRVVVGPGRLEGQEINFGLGVMTRVMELLNPFQKEDKHTDLRCAVLNAAVGSGVVDLTERLVVETDKLTLIGSGAVDLGREVFDLNVYAKASLSLSAGLSNFSGSVKVTGPLRNPSFALNAKGAATTGLSVGAAVATYGLSLIGEDLWTKIFAKAHCKDALAASAPAAGNVGGPGER